jgi:hypothetical protein
MRERANLTMRMHMRCSPGSPMRSQRNSRTIAHGCALHGLVQAMASGLSGTLLVDGCGGNGRRCSRKPGKHGRINKRRYMAKRKEPYREVIVESYRSLRTGGLHGPIQIRPIPGQIFGTHLQVACSKDLVDPIKYPVGTRFKIRAKLTDRLGTGEFLYSYFGWRVTVVSKPQNSN